MADWREGITVGSGLGDLGNTNLTQDQKRDILQRVLGVRDLGATGSQPLPSRPTPLWSLRDVFQNIAGMSKADLERNEDMPFDLLGRAGFPEDIASRLLATAAYARNESKAQPGWRPHTFQESGLENLFQRWLRSNDLNVAESQDYFPGYDMRAWFQAMMANDPKAIINPGMRGGALVPLFPNKFATPFSLGFDPSSAFWNPNVPSR